MTHHQLRRHIQSFSLDIGPLGSQGYTRVLLQLFGYMGHGKSALVNSCNFLPLDEPVEWHKNFEFLVDRVEDMHIDTNVTDLLVPIFVYSVKTTMSKDMKDTLPTFLRNCVLLTGFSPIIVLTHKSGGNYFEVETQFKLLGAEDIIILENYTRADHIQTRQRTTDFLNFMTLALQNVTFRMEQYMNPRRERVEHRKFLLKYIHQSVLEARKREDKERR